MAISVDALPTGNASSPDRHETAAHEARHGVIALALGLPLARIGICANVDAARAHGYCIATDAPISAHEAEASMAARSDVVSLATVHRDLPATLVMVMAGAIGETSTVAPFEDTRMCEQLLAEVFRLKPWTPKVQTMVEAARRTAAVEVHRHRRWIARVAAALIQFGTLSGEEVGRLRLDQSVLLDPSVPTTKGHAHAEEDVTDPR